MELQLALEAIEAQIIQYEVRQADGDGGDSAQRTGFYHSVVTMLGVAPETGTYSLAMQQFEVRPGLYRRTSDAGHWGSNPNNFSADQFAGLQLAFATHSDKKRLAESMWALAARVGFHQNVHIGTDATGTWRDYKLPDFMRPTNLSVFLRGMNYKWSYPLLALLDLGFLADLYLRSGSSDYDNMLLPNLAYAQVALPTPMSRLAWHLYNKKDALEKLERYHDVGPERNGIRGMAALFALLAQAVK